MAVGKQMGGSRCEASLVHIVESKSAKNRYHDPVSKTRLRPDSAAHTFSPITLEADWANLSLKPAWSID